QELATVPRCGTLAAITSQSTSSAVITGGMRQSTGWRREEFPRLSFLPAWKLPGSCHLLRRTRFCTSGRRQSVRSVGLTLIGSSLSPRQPAPASTGRGTDPQTGSRWMSNGTSSSRFPEARQRSSNPTERTEPNQSMKPTAPFRCKSSVFATTPCRGLSLSRWALSPTMEISRIKVCYGRLKGIQSTLHTQDHCTSDVVRNYNKIIAELTAELPAKLDDFVAPQSFIFQSYGGEML